MFIQAVMLLMLKQLNGERTASSIYHLLKGKKSSQTIQDARLFQLDRWFQTAPFLDRKMYDEQIQRLLEKGYIAGDPNSLLVTETGEQWLAHFSDTLATLQHIQGFKLQDCCLLFWKRLTLLVQVTSHLVHENKEYQPVTRDEHIQYWVKMFLSQQRLPKEALAQALHDELIHSLKSQSFEEPLVLVLRLSGKNKTGKTAVQTAELVHMEETEYWYRFLNLLHFLVEYIYQHASQFPLLYEVLKDIYESVTLTQSTKKTAELLNKGYSLAEIAQQRRLKMSTVEDHVVELALNINNFPLEWYVSDQQAEKILAVALKQHHKKLKPIKDQIPDVTYFQIRLVLARHSR
ncbi:helix-turn-helix domain-containing protein [Bacillus sp. FJAT-42315]|uniref:helix-turn-helix domain-containing protein n=1 Tax=Bacillus sp. FJAT-42315 TaxID=2014077 RepID=UPI000C238E68|nr:helix-turn-helix domain-containing protein [Bacillus sp. FJAT-42315]